jgi:uncharacterized membrane protein
MPLCGPFPLIYEQMWLIRHCPDSNETGPPLEIRRDAAGTPSWRTTISQSNQIVCQISLSVRCLIVNRCQSVALPILANLIRAAAANVSRSAVQDGRRTRRRCRRVNSGVVGQRVSRVGSFREAETHTRSVLKAISWRTMGTLDTFAISWFMTGRVEIAGSIAGIEVATKIAWYYLHERVWAAIPWGRR